MQRRYVVVAYPPGAGIKQTFKFSSEEIRHILISMAVLILGFTFFLMGGILNFRLGAFLLLLIISAVGVSTEFLLHELAHKFTAQKYGCWSEYRYTEMGLALTIISGLFGFLIAAPGVVWHTGYVTQKEEGKISAAGPATNLGLGALFLVFYLAAVYFAPGNIFLAYLTWMVGFINVWVGGFNMIPISPFDGSKIARWSIPVYILLFMALILVGVALFMSGSYIRFW